VRGHMAKIFRGSDAHVRAELDVVSSCIVKANIFSFCKRTRVEEGEHLSWLAQQPRSGLYKDNI
jgi:hypothetical protein